MKAFVFSALGLIAVACAGVASAQPAGERPAPATTIRHADLDLTSAQDARAMLVRIRRAAASVCRASPGADGADKAAIELYDDCFRRSVARAVGQLDAPLVTAAYDAKAANRRMAQLP